MILPIAAGSQLTSDFLVESFHLAVSSAVLDVMPLHQLSEQIRRVGSATVRNMTLGLPNLRMNLSGKRTRKHTDVDFTAPSSTYFVKLSTITMMCSFPFDLGKGPR